MPKPYRNLRPDVNWGAIYSQRSLGRSLRRSLPSSVVYSVVYDLAYSVAYGVVYVKEKPS